MKISASVYSNKNEDLGTTLEKLEKSGVDMLHVDCNDDPNVMDDLQFIRSRSRLPIDLHLITSRPEKYMHALERIQPEYLTFQHENLDKPLALPDALKSRLGIAVTSNTDISIFEAYEKRFDFILIMATVPGQSGGEFDRRNFQKIRSFKRMFPGKSVHVDGGVNAEVSFIIRNMGVSAAVSGSFLFKSKDIGSALYELKTRESDSHFLVKDFMLPKEESGILPAKTSTLLDVLKAIDDYKLGFCTLIDEKEKLAGIISNADLRKALIRHHENFNKISVAEMLNEKPFFANENMNVQELIQQIKKQSFPVNFLPVVNDNNEVSGSLTFHDLIKGEL